MEPKETKAFYLKIPLKPLITIGCPFCKGQLAVHKTGKMIICRKCDALWELCKSKVEINPRPKLFSEN